MVENKTNISLLEPPKSEKVLPVGAGKMDDIFTELTKDEEMFNNDYAGFMAKAKSLQDSGKFREAFAMYEMAEILTDRNQPEKVAFITFKMAETLHQLADSGLEGNQNSSKILDEAEMWLNISDKYREAVANDKNDNQVAGKIAYDQASDLYNSARNSSEDIRTVRLPLLDKAEKKLNESDVYYQKADRLNRGEHEIVPKKRGIRLGTKALMGTMKSSIRSALNHRN